MILVKAKCNNGNKPFISMHYIVLYIKYIMPTENNFIVISYNDT